MERQYQAIPYIGYLNVSALKPVVLWKTTTEILRYLKTPQATEIHIALKYFVLLQPD